MITIFDNAFLISLVPMMPSMYQASLVRPSSLRGVSGEMRKKLDQQQHRHRIFKGDPRYFEEEECKTSMMMESNPSRVGDRLNKDFRRGAAHSMFPGGVEEEEVEHMKRSEIHANAFAPDTDSEKDMESEFGFSIGLSVEDGEPGRYMDQDDDIDSVYAEAAAAAVAASVAVRPTRLEEESLMRSEVDSSVMGTESIVRSDGDIDSLVGQHLLVEPEEEDFDDIYGGNGRSVAVEEDSNNGDTRERRHHVIGEDDASLVDGSLIGVPQGHDQQQQQRQMFSGDGGQTPVLYGGNRVEDVPYGSNGVTIKGQMKEKICLDSIDSKKANGGYPVGESDANLRRHHLRKKNDCDDSGIQEVQEHRYPVREDEVSPGSTVPWSVSAAVAALDRGASAMKPRVSSVSRSVSSTAGEGVSGSLRVSTKAGSGHPGVRDHRSFSVDTKKDDHGDGVTQGGFNVGVTARGRGGDGVTRERRAESMRLGRGGEDGGFGSAAEILWERCEKGD